MIKRHTVEMQVVDNVATKLGSHIALIYPDYMEWEDIDD
jgi:hypothetical protein